MSATKKIVCYSSQEEGGAPHHVGLCREVPGWSGGRKSERKAWARAFTADFSGKEWLRQGKQVIQV